MYRYVKMLSLYVIFLTVPLYAQSYTTDFDGTENPLSENGAWVHNGLDWCVVQKAGGIAFGSQTGTGGYDDSYALLTGFPPDQTITGVVHRDPGMVTSCTREVELLLRWTDGAHMAKGYECLFDQGGGIQIVRWNGPLGNFTVLNPTSYGSWPRIAHGDTLKATIVGNRITLYRNGIKRAELVDNSYSTGNPGIGFFRRDCGSNSGFGYTSITASAAGTSPSENLTGRRGIPGFRLEQSAPNPFYSHTTLRYTLASPSNVRVRICNQAGQVVRWIFAGTRHPGSHAILWDGKNPDGRMLPNGVYVARITVNNRVYLRRMVLVK